MPNPYVPVPNVALVELIFRQDNQIMEQTFHVLNAAQWDVSQLVQLGGVFKSWWQTNLLGGCSNTVQLIMIKLTDLTTATSPLYEYLTGLPIGGGNGSTAEPSNVTLAVKFTTNTRGRSYRGRTYHIGLTQNQVQGNVISVGQALYMRDGYFALIQAMITAGYQLVVASRRSAGAPRVTGISTVIIDVQVDITLDSQRRRLPGRGR